MRVLIDADAFIGMQVTNDALYSDVDKLLTKLEQEDDVVIFVTWDVIDEVSTKLRYAASKQTAFTFLDQVYSGLYQVIVPNESLTEDAVDMFKVISQKHTSMTDCMNMVVYQQFNIDAIFSFDKGYKKVGMKLLEEMV